MPIDPITAGALVTAGGSLISGIINHFSNKNLSNNAYKQNVQMWHEQNAYNSPLSQVARLRMAGLNPALAYGASGAVTGTSEQAPQLDYGGVMSQPLINNDWVTNMNSAMTAVAQRKLMDSQVQRNNAATIESLNRGVLTGAKKEFAKDYAIQELRGMTLSNDKLYKECELTDQTINNVIATRSLTKEQIDSLRYANEFADRTMEARIEATQLQNLETRKRFREIEEKIKNYSSQTALVYAKMREQNITNSMLPGLLQNNLTKGIEEINNLRKTGNEIDAMVDRIATETGLNRAELFNYYKLHFSNVANPITYATGATVDSDQDKNMVNFIPNYR